MKKYKVMDGNEACAHIAYLFTEVAAIYPITPSSPMAEFIDDMVSDNKKNIFGSPVKIVEMQSEKGAAGMMHGSLQAGCLSTTFTASQGLLLMIPNMYKMAGELLPGVIHVASRSLATHALSILGDHQDIYATRMTGFAILASSNVQQAHDLAAVTHLSAIKGSIPFVHFFDGFRTSHELQKIEILTEEEIKSLIDINKINEFRNKSLNLGNNVTRGTSENDDVYFQATEVRNNNYIELPNIVNDYMKKINDITGKDYAPFNYYGHKDATKIIVAMGSVCDTIKETIDNTSEKIGLIEVHLYRPFSSKYFFDVLPNTVIKIAVLDKTKEAGSSGEPLYLDVVNMFNDKKTKPTIIGGRYGLSGKDTNPSHIKAIYDFLDKENCFNNFTVGIEDDVTNLSIKPSDYMINKNNIVEFLIWGYGSDGMVGTSKDIIKIMGETTDSFVQGYFQYDSKKSGGITKSHLRLSTDKIRMPYYVSNPHMVVCTKESYLYKYDVLKGIRSQGIVLLNTNDSEENVKQYLPNNVKKALALNNIDLYIVNADELATKLGIPGKISTIIETLIFRITNMLDYDLAKAKLKEDIKERFSKKGESVIEANLKAIDEAEKYLVKINVDSNWSNIQEELDISDQNNIVEMMNKQQGDNLKVSAFLKNPDGTFAGGNTKDEDRNITDTLPCYIKENCIECNLCSLVCPHAVVRPFLLDEKEYNAAPEIIKNAVKDCNEKNAENLKYTIGINVAQCTGCSLCSNICPGKKGEKALAMKPKEDDKYLLQKEASDYLFNKVAYKNIMIDTTVKGSQFKKPYFEYSGACAGCGQPAYIKLITQLYGDRMMIANATGCSSIYGASAPSMPYSIPWANSLFEDNAEFGYGMVIANNTIRNRIANTMEQYKNSVDENTKLLFEKWLNNLDNYDITKEVYDTLDYNNLPKELIELKEYIKAKSIWIVGGDGWAYDIGYDGIDHILSTNDDINILVLDTEVYSNTGGQSSKASASGSLAKFASSGKKTNKKDLARMALCYPNVYVATVSLGANYNQYLKAITEAYNHKGPSIIIAYTPCIAHGIKGGLANSIEEEKLATECGYFPIFRYKPDEEKLYLDSKNANFDLYESFLENETRYSMLKVVNPERAEELLKANKENAMIRFNFYKDMSEK
jgi:pyruvate-ferredoxin/flavodoxin oxidoreductase